MLVDRRGVRILVDRRVDAARARLVDELQRVDALAPVRLADHLVVRDLRRQAALLADLDGLAHAVEHARRFVAHVRDVDAAHAAGDLRELDDFCGRRERARHVEQPGAQAERAVFHPLPHEAAHLVDLGGRRLAVHRTDHLRRAPSPADERAEVRRHTSGRDALEKRLDRQRRRSVGPFHQRGDALPHVVVGGRHLEDAAARVRVDVDEPGRDDLAGGVDHARGRRLDARRDADDGVAAHRDVAEIPRAAGAVDDPAVADDEIVEGRLRARRGDQNAQGTRRRQRDESGAHVGGV